MAIPLHDDVLDGVKVAHTMLLNAEPLHWCYASVAILGTLAVGSLQRPGYLHPTSQACRYLLTAASGMLGREHTPVWECLLSRPYAFLDHLLRVCTY